MKFFNPRDSRLFFDEKVEHGLKRTEQWIALVNFLESFDPGALRFDGMQMDSRRPDLNRRILLRDRKMLHCRVDPANTERGVDELDLVHHSEISRLLSEFGILKHSESPLSADQFGASEFAILGGASVSAKQAEGAIGALLALLDGLEGEELDLLIRCVLNPIEKWDTAQALVESSLTTHDSIEGRLALATVHLDNQAPRKALRALDAANRKGLPRHELWRLYAGLAQVHESVGGDRLALQSNLLASEQEGCGVRPHVDGLFLSLSCGKPSVARKMARRLNANHFASPSVLDCRLDLLRRLKERGVLIPWKPSDLEASRMLALIGGQEHGAAAQVCRDLMGRETARTESKIAGPSAEKGAL